MNLPFCTCIFQCDVIANSVGPKKLIGQNVLAYGNLAKQFAMKGGQGLIDELASSQNKSWTYGDIRFTASHDLNKEDYSPKHIVHFCVPKSYGGDYTYLVTMPYHIYLRVCLPNCETCVTWWLSLAISFTHFAKAPWQDSNSITKNFNQDFLIAWFWSFSPKFVFLGQIR